MSDENQSPTVVILNSNESETDDKSGEHSGDNPIEILDELSEIAGESAGDGENEISSYNPGDAEQNSDQPLVAVAEIEANRDVAIASIESEVERERLGLEAEHIKQENENAKELEECRRSIAELREQMDNLANTLIPPQVSEEATEELSEIAPETNLTEPSTAAPIVETPTELSEESADESPALEIQSRGRRFIAI